MTIALTPPASVARADEILTPEALAFVAELHDRFASTRDELLAERQVRRERYARDGGIEFDPATADIRDTDWTIAELPEILRRRRVEITGPATPAKMAINALNSTADVWLADLEDAATPTWHNVVDAQVVLADASRGTLGWDSPDGKSYRLRTDAPPALMVVRPRGWHLDEANITVDDRPAVGALVDFGLHAFHNARVLAAQGRGPFYYLPKTEHRLEARLWNEIFSFAEERLGLASGTIRATVLIETIPAAFQMPEILFELREHAAGLNAGRWDYLFSLIKTFRDAGPAFVLPDRAQVTMTAPFMRAYTDLLVRTCHTHGAMAIGGMSAFIPNRREPEVTARALEQVRADKRREAADGFDGSWVAHPDLVGICREEFDRVLDGRPNQLDRRREDVTVTAAELLDVASAGGTVTSEGVRADVYATIAYLGSWLSGTGAAAIRNLMEDVATAEISRSQLWQWRRNGVVLADTGEQVTEELVRRILAEESARIREEIGDHVDQDWYATATEMAAKLFLSDDYAEFLTLDAYRAVQSADGSTASSRTTR